MGRYKIFVFAGIILWIFSLVCFIKGWPKPFLVGGSFLLFLIIYLSFLSSSLERQIAYIKRERESLALRLADREKIAEIFEDISKLYDTFVEKIDFSSLFEATLKCARRILEPDFLIVRVEVENIWKKEERIGEKVKFPREVLESLNKQTRGLFIQDLANYPPYDRLISEGFSRMLSCPLHTKDKVYGFIAGFNKTKNFDSTQQFLLSTFSHHIALLIENTQLLEKIKSISLRRERGRVEDLRELGKKLEIEKRFQEREMELARQIQEKLLPYPLPQIKGWEISALSLPSLEVGGDYFDFFPLRGNRFGMVLADVSGKGVPASLIMVMLRTAIHTMSLSRREDPEKTLLHLNQYLYRETEENIFVSLFYGVLYPREGKIRIINAGAESPYIYRSKNKQIEIVQNGGMVLGLMEEWQNGKVKEVTLEKGDSLILYTDGLIEASNPKDELYGEERWEKFLKNNGEENPENFLKKLEKEVRSFAWGEPLSDDITVLVLKRSKD